MSSKPTRDSKDDGLPTVDGARKKVYEKPTFVREQVFETMALACGKIDPTSGPCKSNKKNS
jgi:hypothetical protein